MASASQNRLLALLTRCLAPFFARGYLVVFGLLAVAIVTGVPGLPLVAYFLLCAVVLVVGLVFAGCGFWVGLFAFTLFRRRLKCAPTIIRAAIWRQSAGVIRLLEM